MEKKAEATTSTDAQPGSNNVDLATVPLPQAQISQPSDFQVAKSVAVPAAVTTVPKLQMLKTYQAPSSVSEANTASPFSRDSIVRNLQEMVKPAVSDPDVARPAQEAELSEKEKSALEFAISMYMAANEFYDGGSLWCRQCDDIFTDISALCRHIHSDKHQLVSSALLLSMHSCRGELRLHDCALSGSVITVIARAVVLFGHAENLAGKLTL